MNSPFDPLKAATAWANLSTAYTQMSMAAFEVILRRTMRMSQGAMTGADRRGRGSCGTRRRRGQDRIRCAAADPRQDALERTQASGLSAPTAPGCPKVRPA